MMIVKEMQQYYDRRAPEYDRSMAYDDPEIVAKLEPAIAYLQEHLHGRHALELACGPGFWTTRVAGVAESIFATDFNESTLVQARAKPLPAGRVTLARADAYALDDIPGTYDALYAVDWFSHVPFSRIPEFLRQATGRVLPGSPVIFMEQLPGRYPPSGLTDAEGNPLQERTLADGSTHRVIKHHFTEAELVGIFAPFKGSLVIANFPTCRRTAIHYTTGLTLPSLSRPEPVQGTLPNRA